MTDFNMRCHACRTVSALRRYCLGLLATVCIAAVMPSLAHAGAYDDYFRAVKIDDTSTVSALLKRGFDCNTIEAQRGDTGLILSLREDAMRVFSVLLKAPGIGLDAQTMHGETALMIAAYRANGPAVAALLGKGATVNKEGWTALHYAAAAGDNNIVQMLLDKKAKLDALSPNGTTPIMMAARNGYILTVKLLLDAGADATLKNQQGMTAIDFARQGGNSDIVEGLTYRLKKAGKL